MRTSDEEFPKGGRLILLKSTLSSLPTFFFFFWISNENYIKLEENAKENAKTTSTRCSRW